MRSIKRTLFALLCLFCFSLIVGGCTADQVNAWLNGHHKTAAVADDAARFTKGAATNPTVEGAASSFPGGQIALSLLGAVATFYLGHRHGAASGQASTDSSPSPAP